MRGSEKGENASTALPVKIGVFRALTIGAESGVWGMRTAISSGDMDTSSIDSGLFISDETVWRVLLVIVECEVWHDNYKQTRIIEDLQ